MQKSKILPLIKEHEKLRTNGLNLIASENYLSFKVREALSSDLAGRYYSEWYGGSKFAQKIVETTEELAKKLFKAKHALVTPLSGNICDLTVLFTFTKPYEKVAILPFTVGGYPLGLEKLNRKPVYLPVHENTFNIDVEEAKKLIKKENVKLTILGSSFLLFPHPVRELSKFIKDSGGSNYCVYDGSHVLGLIATGQFQAPLREGADVLFGSTHKTFYGPQGGIILTNSGEHAEVLRKYLDIDIESGIGLVDNPHVNRIAALGIAIEEMLEDKDYGRRVIENAKCLAKVLDEYSVPVKFKEFGFTESHQILLDIDSKRAEDFCHELEEIGIFIDISGRIGVAEVTHIGMGKNEMEEIVELLSEVYFKGLNVNLKKNVKDLVNTKYE